MVNRRNVREALAILKEEQVKVIEVQQNNHIKFKTEFGSLGCSCSPSDVNWLKSFRRDVRKLKLRDKQK